MAIPNTVAPVAPISTVAPISNTPYQVMSPTAATQLVSQYGIDPTQVLSSQNIQQTTTSPAPSPDDLLGIRAQIYNEQGVNASQTAYQAALKAASSATLGLNERLTGLRGRAVSINKIVGQQAQERAVSQGEIDALNESARIAQSDYAAKKGNADEMFQIRNQEISEKKQIMLQYPGAKVTFGDSFAQVSSKLTDYAKQQKKDAYKDVLKAKALELGLKTKGSTKDLEKRISKENKSALADAKYTANLKNQQILADIANTKDTIAHRGDDAAKPKALDLSNTGVAKLIEEEANSGTSWSDIAAKLVAATGNSGAVSTGSFADKYLNYVFGQSTDNPLTTKVE